MHCGKCMCVMCVVLCVDVTPSAVHVGNIVQGARMAWAMGRDIGVVDDESDQAKKVRIRIVHCVLIRVISYDSL